MPLSRWPSAIGFILTFNGGHIMIHTAQLIMFLFIVVPLRALFDPLGLTFGKAVHEELVRWSKASYCLLLRECLLLDSRSLAANTCCGQL